MEKKGLMLEALLEAKKGVGGRDGGPFGAVIAKDGKILARGRNRVPSNNDPTAHAEINAIREACRKLGTFDLSGCEIYTTCEPCPMCLAAIHWARIERIFYGATRKDAAKIGFDDEFFYDVLKGKKKGVPKKRILREKVIPVMRKWFLGKGKINY